MKKKKSRLSFNISSLYRNFVATTAERKLLRLELPLCASSDGVTVKINNNHPLELRKFSLKTLK